MMATAKNLVSNLRDRDLVHRVGSGARHARISAADYARHLGVSSRDLAHRVGPKRGLLGLAILGAVVGGTIFLVRFLRSRSEDHIDEFAGNEDPAMGGKRRKLSRAERRAVHAAQQAGAMSH